MIQQRGCFLEKKPTRPGPFVRFGVQGHASIPPAVCARAPLYDRVPPASFFECRLLLVECVKELQDAYMLVDILHDRGMRLLQVRIMHAAGKQP